mmetsp:Transcript_14140/g.20198  ORF Transcript_14140/g.20198 Transcript_14140/m.20198 type:complete len:111 (+) Transcript_14140:582-914(+)
MTLGGDELIYAGDAASSSTNIIETKILINSVLSTKGAKFMSLDIKNFFLITPMQDYEYVAVPVSRVLEEIIHQYNLRPLIHSGKIFCEVRKGMYGLKQAARIAYNLLVKR